MMNTPLPQAAFDDARAQAFAERLVGALGESALILMTSLGHRASLFDTLAGMSAATSAALADRAGLAERYVREWLAVMVTAGMVEYEAGTGVYHLPAEHAACLTRTASPDNIAVTAQFIGLCASVESQMLARFRSGDGLDYTHFELSLEQPLL